MEGTGNQTERETLILAALLHDIGKFWQRTGEKYDLEYNGLIPLCCPKYINENKRETYTHKHVLWSGNFLRNFLGNSPWLNAENIALYHHLPENAKDSFLAKIVTLGDWLSSGERREREENVGKVRQEPLISIFSLIKGVKENVDYLPHEKYYKLSSLKVTEEVLFPKEEKPEAIESFSYPNLWENFNDEVSKIKNISEFSKFFNALYYLLQKYTILMPSAAYREMADISLFDHSKTTCAISTCLYDGEPEEQTLDEILRALKKTFGRERDLSTQEKLLGESTMMLVGGDISGIQDFIYSITSERAVKGLRGRSFYLQLLPEVVAQYILEDLNLPLSNLLHCGGGHFYLLTPANRTERLEKLRKQISERFLIAHRGRLALIMSWINLSFLDFDKKVFGDKWLEIGHKMGEQKKKKFYSLLKEQYEKIFGPFEEGGLREVCRICGEEGGKAEIKDGKCSLCESFEKLAGEIGRANYIEIAQSEPRSLRGKIRKYEQLLGSFGSHCRVLPEVENPDSSYLLNNTTFLESGAWAGYKFIARSTPYMNDDIKPFNQLAKESQGIPRWGVFRADVDNLGKIFGRGLGDIRTISRVSMLSSLLSLFFSAWVDQIAKRHKENVYVIYSGGDDLFIIGSWSILPDLAERLYGDFRKFTCQNPHITLSGGIFIAPSKKFPAYKAADSAGRAVDMAKFKDVGKDKISFLDNTMSWNEEFPGVKEIKGRIVQLLEKEKVSRALLQTLLSSQKEEEFFKQKKETIFRIWRLLYAFKRFSERHRNAAGKLKELEKQVIINHNLKPFLNVAVRWAEFLTRKEGRQK